MNKPGQYNTPRGITPEMPRYPIPSWFSRNSIVTYLLSLSIISVIYMAYAIPWYYAVSGITSILVFFLYGATLSQKYSPVRIHRQRTFEKRMFIVALIPRILWTLLIYFVFKANYGDAFGFENGDAIFYDSLGEDFRGGFQNGNFLSVWKRTNESVDLSDMGYATYVGFVYWLTGDSIIVVRLLKCIMSAWTVVLVYRVAKRNFGEQTGRIAAIFCALWPNFWYYCGTQLKEVEMVFLGVLFVEQADQMLRSRQFTAWKIIPILLIAAAMFTVRTPLGLVALLALVFSVVMSSSRVVSWGKRIIVGGLAVALIAITMGNRIEEQSRLLLETARSGQQQDNMEWRSTRDNGNVYAKYASTAIFAPMVFTFPFPTMVRPYEGQEAQQLLNGGNYVKNIISFFTILAMAVLLISGKWREHLLPLSFMLGYLVVLSFSNFAQSERFHQPAMPLEFMFAAYGLSIALTKKKYKRWFQYWCGVMFIAALVWNWFKLAGRGLT